MPEDIIAYVACNKCHAEARALGKSVRRYQRLVVGLVDPATVRVWCDRHDMLVRDYPLAEATVGLRCGECGEPLGPGHQH